MLARQQGDVYTYQNTVIVAAQSINTLIQYFQPKGRISAIITTFLEICAKRAGDLAKDRVGKLSLK
jgi:hypothetical protein